MIRNTSRTIARTDTRSAAGVINTVVSALTFGALLLASSGAGASAISNRPLFWAKRSFNGHGQAIESLTIRGADAAGHTTFIRWSLANAGFRKGALDITFQQRTAGPTVYGTKRFKRGSYRIDTHGLGITAGSNSLAVRDGKLVMHFELGKARGEAILTSHGPGLSVRDSGHGFMVRRLLVPRGRLAVRATGRNSARADLVSTVFAIHDASTFKAHRVYDRAVQLHYVRGARMRVIDYIVGPEERGHRPLGFVILGNGGFAGVITAENRSAEHLDHDNDYRVPWRINVQARSGRRTARVTLLAHRRVSRHDDLAKLGWFTRKAVAMWMHPFTYTLAGSVQGSVTTEGAAPLPLPARKLRYKYAQVRE